ncbi:hypothetical protein HY416_02710 [Candidatus Kaiserbacteria bacterium]|nr:hypothetical protein [Candidatus Kaiserbacteria bacterium]
MDSFLEELSVRSAVPVPFAVSHAELERAAMIFLRFLDLPLEVKRELHVPAVAHRRSADGYTDKLYIENKGKDRKEFFHYRPALRERPEYQAAETSHPEVRDFLDIASGLYRQAETLGCEIFKKYFPEHFGKVFIEDDTSPNSVLRFLSYAPQPQAGFCAQPHFDKGVAALALAESAPGLRVGKDDATPLREVDHQDGFALFMPGILLHEYTDGRTHAVWHDVVHRPAEQNVTPSCARWAIVFFFGSNDDRFPAWETVHTPIREDAAA